MKPHEDLKKKVKELISDNKTEKALDLLAEKELSYIGKELILINSRYSKVVDEQRMGISTEEDTQRKFNKINFDLLALIELIGKKPFHNTDTSSSVANITGTGDGGKSNTTKYLLIIGGILLAVLAGFAIMHLMEDPADHGIKPVITTSDPTISENNNVTNNPIDTVIEVPPPTAPPEEIKQTDYSIYKIGQQTEGGIIFYVNPEPKEGRGVLVMATVDLPEGEVYWVENKLEPTLTGANRPGLFEGKTNTKEIVKLFGQKYPDKSNPAKLCEEFDSRGHEDWYLPSQMELDLIYNYYKKNRKTQNLNFDKKYYWSSTEIYYRSFSDGDAFRSLPKYSSFNVQNKAKVRAIRSF